MMDATFRLTKNRVFLLAAGLLSCAMVKSQAATLAANLTQVTLQAGQPSNISIYNADSDGTIFFSYSQSGSLTGALSISVGNQTPTTMTLLLANPSPPCLTQPGGCSETITLSPGGLSITVTYGGSTGSSLLTVSTNTLYLPSSQGGASAPVSSSFTVSTNSSTPVSFQVTAASSGWLAAAASAATVVAGSPATVQVSAVASTLANSATPYTGTITITDQNGNTISVTVYFPVGTTAGTGVLTATPNPVNLAFNTGSSAPSTTIALVSQAGAASYTAAATSTGLWLAVGGGSFAEGEMQACVAGSTPTCASLPVSLTNAAAQLSTGNYQGTIHIAALDMMGTTLGTVDITVNLTVNGGSTPANAITIVSGNNQSANPGQNLTNPLVAKVVDASGNSLIGQQVTWTVTPAGAATLSNTTTVSDASGLVSTNVTLASAANGSIQVKVALASNANVSATFTATANIPVSGIQKISGDNQTAVVGSAFSQPLVIQVVSGNQPVANFPVQFSISGPGTITSSSSNTDSSGRAQASVTAGNTTGTVTVTVIADGQSVSFNLTVSPAAPQISASSFASAAGFFTTDSGHAPLSPCAIAAVNGPGLAPNVQGVIQAATFGPAPAQLANVSISFAGSNVLAPIFSVSNVSGQQQVIFQVPCDVKPGEGNVAVTVTVNGVSTTVNNATVRLAGPGIYETTLADGSRQAVILRSDGTFMDSNKPVHPGEVVTMFVTGIGPVSPAVATNAVPASTGSSPAPTGRVVVGMTNSASGGAAGVRVVSTQLSTDQVGVAQVMFQVPANQPSGTWLLAIGVLPPDGSAEQFSQLSKITVGP